MLDAHAPNTWMRRFVTPQTRMSPHLTGGDAPYAPHISGAVQALFALRLEADHDEA